MESNVKYVILSAFHEWNYYSWLSVKKDSSVVLMTKYSEFLKNRIFRWMWRRRTFRKSFLVKYFWFPYICNVLNIQKHPSVLLVYDWHPISYSPLLIRFLKEKYSDLTVVYCFTNVVRVSGAKQFCLIDSLKTTYDQIYAFDPKDAKKYGFQYSKLIYAPGKFYEVPREKTEYDLFYIGKAKDRYPILIEILKKAKSEGLKCKFFITGVPEEDQYEDKDITYNKRLSYGEVLEYIMRSNCIVDAIQRDSCGLTIKTCEAIVLGKKLITTNHTVKEEPFFRESNILIYDEFKSIKEFINRPFITYSNSDKYEFSPYRLFNQISGLKNSSNKNAN